MIMNFRKAAKSAHWDCITLFHGNSEHLENTMGNAHGKRDPSDGPL